LAAAAADRGVPVHRIAPEKLRARAGSDHHQGVAAEVGPYPLAPLPAQEEIAEPFFLVIDSVVDPHNLGALLRTALCVGVDAVILPKDRAALPTPVVSKASAGAMEHIRITVATNLARTLTDLKNQGVWVSGMDVGGAKSIFDSDFTGPLAVVVGGEEKGIRPLVRQQCDFLVSIPQKGPVNSLNASVAGGVVMYEAFRQRLAASPKN
jgi:23S rRNA (guanosine2251-2'-O)-methyltransferase